MTEAEKTEMAILKAKADQKTKSQIEQSKTQEKKAQEKIQADELLNKPKESKIEPKIETKEPKKPKEPKVDKNKFPYEVKLGENKIVNYKPWTGKTKKKFKKLFEHLENPEDIDFKGVIRILIRDNIDTPNLYISDDEQQYLTALIRKVSIQDDFEFSGVCDYCGAEQTIKTKISNAIKYRPNKFPQTKGGVVFKDIESYDYLIDVVDDIINSDDYDGLTTEADIEFALHLELDKSTSPLEVLDKIDEMPLNQLDVLMNTIEDMSSDMKIKEEKTCKECSKKSEFSSSEIPGLFESLLK